MSDEMFRLEPTKGPLAEVHHLPSPPEPLVDESAYIRGQRDTLWTMQALLDDLARMGVSSDGQVRALHAWAERLNPETQ